MERGIRRALGVPLAVLMLAPSVVIPILDRVEFEHVLAVEQPGHDPSRCPAGHDHTVCMQVRANHPVPAIARTDLQSREVVSFTEPHSAAVASPRPTRVTNHPRAPPLV